MSHHYTQNQILGANLSQNQRLADIDQILAANRLPLQSQALLNLPGMQLAAQNRPVLEQTSV